MPSRSVSSPPQSATDGIGGVVTVADGRVVLGIHFTPRDLNDRDLYLDGRGIELQPSAFCWQVPTKLRDPELTPILVYPIQHAPGILRQASTEPARRCSISPAAASHQASVLRQAGLITTRRDSAS